MLLTLFVRPASAAQSNQAQTEQQQIEALRSDPVVMTRAYGRFFAYQHHLDGVAAQLGASGKDTTGLRSSFQKLLGFSDAEYEPIRTSCDRLAAEIASLDGEAKSNPENGASYATAREQAISAEIAALTQELSTGDRATLESLIVRMFVPQQYLHKGVQQ